MGGSQRSSPTKVFEYTKDILTALYYALHLFRTIQAASEHKLTALHASEQAIVTIKAYIVHLMHLRHPQMIQEDWNQ